MVLDLLFLLLYKFLYKGDSEKTTAGGVFFFKQIVWN